MYVVERENMFKIKIYVNRRGKSPIKEWMSKLNKEAETNKDSRVNLKKLYYIFRYVVQRWDVHW